VEEPWGDAGEGPLDPNLFGRSDRGYRGCKGGSLGRLWDERVGEIVTARRQQIVDTAHDQVATAAGHSAPSVRSNHDEALACAESPRAQDLGVEPGVARVQLGAHAGEVAVHE